MKKMIALLIASAVIVGTAYYWWIFPIGFIALIGWSMFRVNKKQKKLDKKVSDMYIDREGEISDHIEWGKVKP